MFQNTIYLKTAQHFAKRVYKRDKMIIQYTNNQYFTFVAFLLRFCCAYVANRVFCCAILIGAKRQRNILPFFGLVAEAAQQVKRLIVIAL